MVPHLTDKEVEWLREKYPKLFYFADSGHIVGDFEFVATYKNIALKDRYSIDIALFQRNFVLPKIYITDKRIHKAALKLGRDLCDMHINKDDSLCLIRPDKVFEHYPLLCVSIEKLMYHITTYFYWQSYLETYGSEPWAGEEHGWPVSKL